MSDKRPGEVHKKNSKPLIDSRFLKILSAKKDDIQDSLIFVCLNEDKYGHLDRGQLRKMVEAMEKIAPDSCWFGVTKNYEISFIDRKELANKDLLITVDYENPDLIDQDKVEEQFKRAIPEAASIKVVHTQPASISIAPTNIP